MPLSNLHILVIDSDYEIKSLIQRYLLASGAQVSGYCDATSVLQCSPNPYFHCIVSEAAVLNQNNGQFVDEIRQKQQAITPLIIISSDSTYLEAGIPVKGAQGFLQKPFALTSLKNLILATQAP